MGNAVRIAMVAGEASGDLLASLLIGALRKRLPDAMFFGIGGPRMQAQGFDAWWPLDQLSVMGYVDALKNYREIAGIRRQLKKRLLETRPDIFIGVDAPDFNLGLETELSVLELLRLQRLGGYVQHVELIACARQERFGVAHEDGNLL